MSAPSPSSSGRSFRLVCAPGEAAAVESLLGAEGYRFEPEPFFALARRLTAEPRPLGESLAARFGLVYIQDRSSMLPPLLLAPSEGASVLDMCASPGSKTGLLAQLVGPAGFALGNEPSRDRLETLRANLRRIVLPRAATCSYPGEQLPLREGSWPFILLDPPCSGWGTIKKNPKAAVLWTEDKTEPLIKLQRDLLKRACELLAPGGTLVYSTCTTHVRENEDQIRFALDGLPLTLSAAEPFPGFVFADSFPGTLRVEGDLSEAQGFYLARFVKEGGQAAEPGDAAGGCLEPDGAGREGGAGVQESPTTGHGREERPGRDRRGRSDEARRFDGADGERGVTDGRRGRVGQGETGRGGRAMAARFRKSTRDGGPSRAPARFKTPGIPGQELDPADLFADLGPLAPFAMAAAESGVFSHGRFFDFSGRVFFLPGQAFELLPQSFRWQGFPVGKLSGGVFRPDPRLRAILPRDDQLSEAGLDVDDPALLHRLLRGESLPFVGDGKYAVLSWRGLPLGLLKIRAGRALWSEK